MPTNDHDHNPHGQQVDAEHPGYETTDVNVGGVSVFLAALFGFVIVFFFLCYFMGRVINTALLKEDGPVTRWNTMSDFAGAATTGGKRQDLTSNPVLQQQELQQMTSTFPEPRLDIDDGNQATADLHAHEDLLLDHYSTGENGSIRIPISRAMQLIAQHGLPVNTSTAASAPVMVGDAKPVVQAPLTSGFARTGYELDTIEAREQKMSFGKAEAAEASLKQK